MSTAAWFHKSRIRISARGIFLAVVIVGCLLPLVWTALASLEIRPNNLDTPPTWSLAPTLERYLEIGVAEPQFVSELITSTSLSAATTLLTTLIAFLAAYSLARSHFK